MALDCSHDIREIVRLRLSTGASPEAPLTGQAPLAEAGFTRLQRCTVGSNELAGVGSWQLAVGSMNTGSGTWSRCGKSIIGAGHANWEQTPVGAY